MMLRMAGAALVTAGSAGFGFVLAAHSLRRIRMLRQLIRVLQEMEWELKFRLTPLPELCIQSAGAATGPLRQVFLTLGQRLDRGGEADVSGCLNGLLNAETLPRVIRDRLRELGRSLGRFDLEGQIQGLQAVTEGCRRELEALEAGGRDRVRSYQTLALCAGAALAILLI